MQKAKTQQKRKFVEPTLKKEASLVDRTLGVRLVSGAAQKELEQVDF